MSTKKVIEAETPTEPVDAWLAEQIERAKNEEFWKKVVLTPALARNLLEINYQNRKIKRQYLDEFSSDMRDDLWKFNPQPVQISDCGRMYDGQHRCEAVIRAGKSVETVIWFGLPFETREGIDQHARRTATDKLHMRRVRLPQDNGTATRFIMSWNRSKQLTKAVRDFASSQAVDAYHKAHPEIIDYVEAAGIFNDRGLGSRGLYAFLWWLCDQRSKDSTAEFMYSLATGTNLCETSPIYRARERLLKLSGSGGWQVNKERAHIVVTAFNKFRNGDVVKQFRVDYDCKLRPR